MGLKEAVKKDIDEMQPDELVVISEQIRLLKRAKAQERKAYPIEDVRKMTASSTSTWSDDVISERLERG